MTHIVYLAGGMSGLPKEQVTGWRKNATRHLRRNGFHVLSPLRGKSGPVQ